MKSIFKRISIILCGCLIVLLSFGLNRSNDSDNILTRSFELTNSQINGETCYKEFDYYQCDLVDDIVVFNGYNTFAISELYDLDLVSNDTIAESTITTKYICNYDYKNSVVTLSIALVEENDIEILDTIYGVMSMNENLEFDVSFDVEGEIVFLSELSNIEIIENCGFFKKIVNKVKQKVEDAVDNIVDTTKKVLSTTSGQIGTIVTVAACAVAGTVCAVVPGCQVGTAIFVGMAIGYIGGATTAAISTYQQDGEIDWNAVCTYGELGAIVGGTVSGIAYGVTTAITNAVSAISESSGSLSQVDALNNISKTNGFGDLSQAEKYGIKPYSEMTKELKGTGLQAHHIVDQRFKLGIEDTVAVTTEEHQIFTNGMRKILPYGNDYTINEIWEAAQSVYADYPAILDAIRSVLGF